MLERSISFPFVSSFGARRPNRNVALPLLLSLIFTGMAHAQVQLEEKALSPKDRKSLSVTVYNHGTALVVDTRSAALNNGDNRIAFPGVSGQMRPETVRISSNGDSLNVIEQNFEYDLLTPAKLLEKYVGKEIGLVRRHPQTDEELTETGTLLSVANGQPVFQIGNRIETGGAQSPWRYVFNEVPANLRAKPTLTVDLASKTSGKQELELAYLSGGMGWKSDYVATLNANDKSMDLVGWVTLNNNSGASYENADLRLVAGELNKVQPVRQYKNMRAEMAMMDSAGAPQQESLFEYYLYSFPRKTTIRNNQTKQLQLLSATNIPIDKVYRVDSQQNSWRGIQGGQRSQANVVVQFNNNKPALGMPLPKGVMRFYKADKGGGMQLLGEDRINHTARNERLEMKLGQAFDITADRKQLSYKKGYNNSRVTGWELEVRNAKSTAVNVEVVERVYGDVTVLEESEEHQRVSANLLKWTLKVPANGKAKLRYRIQQK